ncbi:hypothetical protein GCK72_017266 [Caenorhabditis remanei]|uniref:G-protein coupled receptors family 1 profile domain-containing protein n=1 Tax=Caenorhabditis remanei TaxID=31234 RepID=A0A6A5G7Q7_CAERE|nr:hypothetical protein GCK72_017266 [Caenorhabditis remanei]KAF1750715.1 hypothetical protein GCK72_017266 [Caenorhabditis remanei]
MAVAFIVIYIITICGSMIYLGAMTYFKLSEYQIARSDRMLKLQRQLWIALIVQTVNPILFMYLPILIMYIVPIFRISFGPYANLNMIAFAIYPPLDQIFIIYIIKDFRQCVKKIFCDVVRRTRKGPVNNNIKNNHTDTTGLHKL